MIEIKNVSKIYKSKKKNNTKALDNVSLKLPSSGLVFVIGKSGSGKSTLLNLIGGLDNITSGNIIVDGNDITNFKENQFANYRNNHIGFIFQDYHLLDELTVFENIVLSLKLNKIDDENLVYEALEKVGLKDYGNRYPSELSGGERQRVAIARAIVKKPYLILADEPTGNLDNVTATSIVELLKKLSKDCLILIVSHNTIDTYKYADRIIKLSKGKIISDESRNPSYSEELVFDNNTLYYPSDKLLTDEDVNILNNKLKDNSIKEIIKVKDKYNQTISDSYETKSIEIENKNPRFKDVCKLCLSFLKNKMFRISISSFMIAVIMVILSLSQTIIKFDGSDIIQKEMDKSNQSTLLLNKTVDEETQELLNKKYHVEINKEDIAKFYDNGYKGDIYPVINVTLPVTLYENSAGEVQSHHSSSHPYLRESLGTIIVDEEFLENKFGEIEYLAKANYQDPAGLIITDYLADAILKLNTHYTNKDYTDIVGKYRKTSWSNYTHYVNAIIKTNYKERNASLFERFEKGEIKPQDLFADKDFAKFSNEIYEKLGYCYTTNTNFIDDYKNTFATVLPYRQKILVNDVLELQNDSLNRLYMVEGSIDNNKLAYSWCYKNTPPTVPENAKYIRVSFGGTSTYYDINENPLYYVFHLEHAKLVFSDGSTPSKDLIDYERNKWLNTDGTSDDKIEGWQKSQLSDYIEIPEGTYIKEFVTFVEQNHAYCSFYDEDKKFISSCSPSDKLEVKDGTIHFNYENYNQLFNTKYNENNLSTFVPHPIKLTQYRFYDHKNEVKLFEKEFMITKLVTSATELDKQTSLAFANNQVYNYALYFDGNENIGSVINLANKLNYEYQSLAIEGIHTMTRAVDVFIPIFELVAIVLCIGVIFILINFASKMIKDKLHEIGILKALGTKNITVGIIFGLQIALIAILTIILSTLGYFLFIDLANDVLIASLKELASSRIVLDLDFLTFKLDIALLDALIIVGLSILSFIVPMLQIYRIKPVQIIKSKE